MKLDDFLKCKKVRCVKERGELLTIGKEYDVLDRRVEIKIIYDEGYSFWFDSDQFEPVLDSAENPLQGVELTPEFEVVAPHVNPPSNDGATYVSEPYNDVLFPRFEVGQKAYCPWLNDGELVTLGLDDNGDLIAQTKKGLQAFDCEGYALDCTPRQPDLFPATNYYFEHLSAIMPWIKFEQPPTQADIDNEAVDKLAQAMKNKLAKKREQGYHGWETCKHGDLVQLLINHVDKGDPIDVANFCAFLFARGEQLTQGGTR